MGGKHWGREHRRPSRRGVRRRVVIGGVGAIGLSGAGSMLYQAAPAFWRQFAGEFRRPIAGPNLTPDSRNWPDRGLYAAWLGHSTVLLKIDGFTIITDPVFSDRAGLDLGLITLGVKRLIAPAIPLDDLPHIDLILLSHAHMDHFDIPSLRALESKATSVVNAWETSDLLRARRYRSVQELRWGQSARVGPATVKAFEVNHWGARMRTDNYRGYNAYVIETGRYKVLFAGDTADTHTFKTVKSSRPIDLAIMPIGAYDPWIRNHCTPEQAWRMGNEAGSEVFLPVHHRTFSLSREPLHEPLERFLAAAGRHQDRVPATQVGAEVRIS